MNNQHTVHVTAVIKAPATKIWEFMRDFNGLANFHPAIKGSKIEQGNPTEIGCIRYLTLESGFVREKLLLLDDKNFALDYSILESSLGFKKYVASVRLKNSNNGINTICEWWADFDVEEGIDKQEIINIVEQNVFKAGFVALADKLHKQFSMSYH